MFIRDSFAVQETLLEQALGRVMMLLVRVGRAGRSAPTFIPWCFRTCFIGPLFPAQRRLPQRLWGHWQAWHHLRFPPMHCSRSLPSLHGASCRLAVRLGLSFLPPARVRGGNDCHLRTYTSTLVSASPALTPAVTPYARMVMAFLGSGPFQSIDKILRVFLARGEQTEEGPGIPIDRHPRDKVDMRSR